MMTCAQQQMLLLALLLLLLAVGNYHAAAAAAPGDPFMVPRVTYTGTAEEFATWLSQHTGPVIVERESSPTETQWAARVVPWTPEFLVEHAPDVTIRAKNDTDPRFLWGCCHLKSYYLEQYFDKVKQVEATDGKEFVYFSSEMEKLPASAAEFFLAGIWPFEMVHIKEVDEAQYSDYKHLVWLGSKGVITPFHFDEMHNVFLQVYGRKRFTLLPPSAWKMLYLYPKFHIRHRNVQLPEYPLPEEMLQDFPLYEYVSETPFIADLNPGDVLYLPPLWFHQVEALTTSISVNVWSPSKYIEKIMTAWGVELPFDYSKMKPQQMTLLTNYFIQTLVQETLQVEDFRDAEAFIRMVVETRYRRIYDDFLDTKDDLEDTWEPTISMSPRLNLDSLERKEHEAYLDSLKETPPVLYMDLGSALQLCSPEQRIEIKTEEILKINKKAKKIASILRRGKEGLIQVYLANYIEDLAAQFVGERAIFPYMKYCAAAWIDLGGDKSTGKPPQIKDRGL